MLAIMLMVTSTYAAHSQTLVSIQAFSLVKVSGKDKRGLSEGSKGCACAWCYLE